jgi:hypothetical protein
MFESEDGPQPIFIESHHFKIGETGVWILPPNATARGREPPTVVISKPDMYQPIGYVSDGGVYIRKADTQPIRAWAFTIM